MSDSNRISSADSFLEELEASAELPGRHCGLEHLLIQQVGNNTEFIVREIDSTSTACLKSDFPLNVVSNQENLSGINMTSCASDQL